MLFKKYSTVVHFFVFIMFMSTLCAKNKDPFYQCNEYFKGSNYDEATYCYGRVFPSVTDKNFIAQGRLNYAEALLGQGDYINGFRELDHRLQFRDSLQKPWDGSDPRGKTILVYAEQGLGDTYMFSRYLAMLKELGAARVILLAQSFLKQLLSGSPYIDVVIKKGDPIPEFDADVYLMSLPRYIAQENGQAVLKPTQISTIPKVGQYIFSNASLKNQWRKKLAVDTNIKIGIRWRSQNLPAGQVRRLERDIPLEMLVEALNIEGISLYSFSDFKHRPIRQQEFEALKASGNAGELDEWDVIPDDFPIVHGIEERKENGPFMDFSAALENMDLVISVDTGTPNMAAAMYKPVWILLPYESDWRWGTDRSNVSPWHPTAHLFWQQQQGDWIPVVQEVRIALIEFVQQYNNNSGGWFSRIFS